MNVRFLVLAFLERHPAHGYAVRRWLHVTGATDWAEVKPYSVHHALSTLERDGLVRPREDLSTARRRIVEITPEGRAELSRLRAALWDRHLSVLPSQLYTLLSFPDPDPAAVRERAHASASRARETERGWQDAIAADPGAPPVWVALSENGLAHLRADIRLLDTISRMSDDEIMSGAPDDQGEVQGIERVDDR